eukprot:9446833-Lingulodinium_polyedra.AAC.1
MWLLHRQPRIDAARWVLCMRLARISRHRDVRWVGMVISLISTGRRSGCSEITSMGLAHGSSSI